MMRSELQSAVDHVHAVISSSHLPGWKKNREEWQKIYDVVYRNITKEDITRGVQALKDANAKMWADGKDPTWENAVKAVLESHTGEISTCVWKHKESTGYTDKFSTSCGHTKTFEKPIEVGFSLTPDAEELGPFCVECGKKIVDAKRLKKLTRK